MSKPCELFKRTRIAVHDAMLIVDKYIPSGCLAKLTHTCRISRSYSLFYFGFCYIRGEWGMSVT